MTQLGPLFHWSPEGRRAAIRAEGLQPFSHPTLHCEDDRGPVGFPYVCLGTNPSSAWRLSGDMGWATEVEAWDLWQIDLAESDEVHVMPEFGARIKEIRIRNAIAADRCWWVASRQQQGAAPVR